MNILITGSNSGLGLELVKALKSQGHIVYTYDIADGGDVRSPNPALIPAQLDVLINNAGINRINWLQDVTDAEWDAVMDTNAKGIFKMAQACLPQLTASRGVIVNVVSNAAHMPMTCSAAYNASKGAAHILTLQLARELTRSRGITVFGVAPNKMSGTGMSDDIDDQVVRTRGWSKEFAHEYQLKGLLTGEETPPRLVAEFIAYLLSSKDNHRFLSGCVLPYGA